MGYTDSYNGAVAEAVNCDFCGLSGQVVVYHPDYDGERFIVIDDRRIASRVTAHCVCPVGRWMRRHTSEDIRKRIPDFNDVLTGHANWFIEDPSIPHPHGVPT